MVSCTDLNKIYSTILEPYLFRVKRIIDKEELIMGEFYYYLENKKYDSYNKLSDFLLQFTIPTEVKNYFWYRFISVCENLINYIVSLTKGKMLYGCIILPSYQLELKVYTN